MFVLFLQMQVGDIILEINGEPVHGKTTKEGMYEYYYVQEFSVLSSRALSHVDKPTWWGKPHESLCNRLPCNVLNGAATL